MTRESAMPFGKFKGTKIKDLPSEYIYGLLKAGWLKGKLLTALINENANRYAQRIATPRFNEEEIQQGLDMEFLEDEGMF